MSPVSVMRTAALSAVLSLSVSALGMPASAQAVVPAPEPLSKVTVGGLTSVTQPFSNDPQDSPFTVTFVGAAADYDDTSPADSVYVAYDGWDEDGETGPVITKLASKDNTIIAPEVSDFPDMETMAANAPMPYTMETSYNTSPGKYRLTVPITQAIWTNDVDGWINKTVATTADFTVVANPKVSSDQTSFSLKGKFSSKSAWKGKVDAPNFEDGATLTLYFTPKGGKQAKVYSTKLDSKGNKSITLGKGKVRKTGTMLVKIGSVTYAPGYSFTVKVK